MLKKNIQKYIGFTKGVWICGKDLIVTLKDGRKFTGRIADAGEGLYMLQYDSEMTDTILLDAKEIRKIEEAERYIGKRQVIVAKPTGRLKREDTPHGEISHIDFKCGACRTAVEREWNYCPNCARAIDWGNLKKGRRIGNEHDTTRDSKGIPGSKGQGESDHNPSRRKRDRPGDNH